MSSVLGPNSMYILNSNKYYKLVIIACSISTNSIIKVVNLPPPNSLPQSLWLLIILIFIHTLLAIDEQRGKGDMSLEEKGHSGLHPPKLWGLTSSAQGCNSFLEVLEASCPLALLTLLAES